eukprot:scaffold17564_cov59-Attheya_sp.AAC.2
MLRISLTVTVAGRASTPINDTGCRWTTPPFESGDTGLCISPLLCSKTARLLSRQYSTATPISRSTTKNRSEALFLPMPQRR